MVLCSGTDQCGPANIDILDATVEVRAARYGRFERIEIDREKID